MAPVKDDVGGDVDQARRVPARRLCNVLGALADHGVHCLGRPVGAGSMDGHVRAKGVDQPANSFAVAHVQAAAFWPTKGIVVVIGIAERSLNAGQAPGLRHQVLAQIAAAARNEQTAHWPFCFSTREMASAAAAWAAACLLRPCPSPHSSSSIRISMDNVLAC